MDLRVLRNVLATARMGSLTGAAEDASLTLQALAAQIKKAEQLFGFPIFIRSNRGVELTPEGQQLLPHIMAVVKSADDLTRQARHINQRQHPPLRIALNSTFSPETNQRVMGFFITQFAGSECIFTTAETPDNLQKIAGDELDIAVILGESTLADGYQIPLNGLSIEVIAAHSRQYHDPADYLIRPQPACPYSNCFARFSARYQAHFPGARLRHSGSELATVALVNSLNAIGILSRDVALAHQLTIFPDYTDRLNASLIMKRPLLTPLDTATLTRYLDGE